jgi:hypothetical protein
VEPERTRTSYIAMLPKKHAAFRQESSMKFANATKLEEAQDTQDEPKLRNWAGCAGDPNPGEARADWGWLSILAFGILVRSGLTSWSILSRPFGTSLGGSRHPGRASWATLSQTCGTGRDSP